MLLKSGDGASNTLSTDQHTGSIQLETKQNSPAEIIGFGPWHQLDVFVKLELKFDFFTVDRQPLLLSI
jgi:hypothetical protein